MKRLLLFFGMLGLLAGCQREQTTYAPSFDQKKFWETKIHTEVEDALVSVGLPMRAWLYYTDNNPKNQSHEIKPLTKETLLEACHVPLSYVVCYYSQQADPKSNYVRSELYFVRGRLEKNLKRL
jgi:hypothetical protein